MVGPAMGPMIGGWLSDSYWHWIFLLNIPFCIFSGAIVLIFLEEKKRERRKYYTRLGGNESSNYSRRGASECDESRWNIYDWFRSPTIVGLFYSRIHFSCFLYRLGKSTIQLLLSI